MTQGAPGPGIKASTKTWEKESRIRNEKKKEKGDPK
jgi:hypothetical protein